MIDEALRLSFLRCYCPVGVFVEPSPAHVVALATYGTAVRYFIPDGNRNILQLRDANGTATDSYAYGPFGQCAATGTTPNPFRFSCEYLDAATGLVYYNFRHYHPGLGRWTSRDPMDIQVFTQLAAYLMCNISRDTDD